MKPKIIIGCSFCKDNFKKGANLKAKEIFEDIDNSIFMNDIKTNPDERDLFIEKELDILKKKHLGDEK